VLRVLSHHSSSRADFDQQLPDEFRGAADAVIEAKWMLQQAPLSSMPAGSIANTRLVGFQLPKESWPS
jgi:hypothetical protein